MDTIYESYCDTICESHCDIIIERSTVYREKWVANNETVILQNGFVFWNPYKLYKMYIHR
jgi:hypothetical protein